MSHDKIGDKSDVQGQRYREEVQPAERLHVSF